MGFLRKEAIMIMFLNALLVQCRTVVKTQNTNEIDPFLIHKLEGNDCVCKGGVCVEEDGKDVCTCPPGYGKFSSITCKACNCGPDANCTFTDLGFWKGSKKDCICKPGYVDNNGKCEGLCSNNPCKNGGTCKDVKNGYECVCPSQYTGQDCSVEENPCTSNPCKNGGNCTVSGRSFTCDCVKPYRGPTCETSPCRKEPCQNGGTCKVGKTGYICSCRPPYTGPTCENDPCTYNRCLNNGICKVEGTSFKCNCQIPFFGDKCEKDPCSSNPCGNGGKCKIIGTSFSCDCPKNFVGNTCQHVCNCENGKCKVTSDDKVLCECLPEFGKKSDKCVACDCGKGANCTWDIGKLSNTKYCLCPDGSKLQDKNCESPCRKDPCLNNGICKVDGNGFKCECKSPFSGPTCKEKIDVESDPCKDNPCSNNGICKVDGKDFKCECKLPFTGPTCKNNLCTKNPCQNGGTCEIKDSLFQCNCRPPYFGNLCEKNPCAYSPCENGGTCKIIRSSFICDCPDNFVGKTCQHACKCENGKCEVTADDKVLCECLPEFGKKADNCIACDCGRGANCTWDIGVFRDTKYCLCPDGSKLQEKNCESPCRSNPCLNNGICKVDGRGFKCECESPFTGPTCKDNPCSNNPCEDRGTCSLNGNSFKCNCKKPYFGDKCEKDACTDNPCKGRGNCTLTGNSFKCECRKPYFGNKCEKDPCSNNPCRNRGNCSLSENSFKCNCKKPYFGDKCGKDPCSDNPCKDRGVCSLLGNSYKCSCKPPYFGNNCEKSSEYSVYIAQIFYLTKIDIKLK